MRLSSRVALAAVAASAAAGAAGVLSLWGQGITLPAPALLGLAAAQAAGGVLLLGVLRHLGREALAPVRTITDQIADAGEGRFTYARQPEVEEWVPLGRAANIMVSRLEQAHAERNQAFDALREEVDLDSLTGLHSRARFMEALAHALQPPARPQRYAGALVILRVHDLVGVNQRAGRARGDELLRAIGTLLRQRAARLGGEAVVMARLNGADFGVLVPERGVETLLDWLADLAAGLKDLHADALADREDVAWLGATGFAAQEEVSQVLARADTMVQASETQRQPFCYTAAAEPTQSFSVAQWRVHIEQALETGQVGLALRPVVGAAGQVVHREASLRLTLVDGTVLNDTQVMPPAARTGRTADLDLRLIELALLALDDDPGSIAVNLAPQSVQRPIFLQRLRVLLQAAGAKAARLLLEVHEAALDSHRQDLLELMRCVAPFGTRVGLDHVGRRVVEATGLAASGLRFLKIAPAIYAGAHADPQRRRTARALRSLMDAPGCELIATGLDDPRDLPALFAAGFSGASGPAVH